MVAAKRETRPLKLKPFAGRTAFVNVIERRPLVHLLFKLAHLLELLASALLKNALGSLAVFFALEISTSFERIPANRVFENSMSLSLNLFNRFLHDKASAICARSVLSS